MGGYNGRSMPKLRILKSELMQYAHADSHFALEYRSQYANMPL